MEISDVVVEEKLRTIIEMSARASFGPLIEKEPDFLEAPLFKKFTKSLISNICGSFKKAYIISVLLIVFLFYNSSYAQNSIGVVISDSNGKKIQNELTSLFLDCSQMQLILQLKQPFPVQAPLTVIMNGIDITASISSTTITLTTISMTSTPTPCSKTALKRHWYQFWRR